jgi:hypothetical protein
MLDLFGMQQGGSQYRRLISAFRRVFGATIFFGTDTQREKAIVMHRGRFNLCARLGFGIREIPNKRRCPEPLRMKSFSVMSAYSGDVNRTFRRCE